jgi:hypothetical protein
VDLSQFEIQVASPPNREKCVVEIWHGQNQVCEVNEEYGDPVVEIYPNPSGGPWLFDYSTFFETLQRALKALRGVPT